MREVRRGGRMKPLCPLRRILPLDIAALRKTATSAAAKTSRHRARNKLKVLENGGFRCAECGATEELTIAHIVEKLPNGVCPGRNASAYRPDWCRVLCVECHVTEENAYRLNQFLASPQSDNKKTI